ncbi:MAG: cyclic nucleotide-binding domain-containing protein [Deltaproteobacteria bacterium]|nr:cyclic nucleotide-binding domain-containing protein [Deltaproteobacteria bacterium]
MTRWVARVARLLAVEHGEGRVLAWSSLALFAVSWGSISVANVADTLFLKRIGVDRLPWVFLGNSVLLTFTTFAVGRLALRVESRRLLIATLVALGLALVPLWLLVAANVDSAFVLLVLAAKQLDAIALVVFWTAVGSLVSARQGKRLFAQISAGGTLGAIAGSFASGWLGRTFGIAALLPIAGITMGIAAAAIVPLLRMQPARYYRPARAEPLGDDASRRLGSLWRGGALFRVLVLASLLAGILGPILYFEFAYVADQATQGHGGEQRLLDLYALFRGWLNVGVMLIQMIGTPAVFRRLGVPLAAALSPLIYLLGLVGLSVQLSLGAGIAAVAGVNLQDHAVYDPAQRILVTLFPERVRAAVTTLIDGPVKRAGGLVGNVLIITALAFGTPLWVGYAGLPVAAAWLVLALVLWRLYPTMLLQVATARRSEFEDPPPLTDLLDGGTVRLLEQSLVSTDLERCRAACEIVVEAIPRRAVRALARALRAAPEAHRTVLIAALHRVLRQGAAASLMPDESVRHLAALLANPGALGPLDRAHLVQAYARLLGPGAKPWPPALRAALADPHPAVALAARAALARAGATTSAELDAAVRGALASADADARRLAREELRTELRHPTAGAGWDAQLAQLLSALEAPADRVHAARALAEVAEVHGERLRPHAARILPHRLDPDVAVRIAVLDFIGHARLADAARDLVQHLTAEDAREAAAARRALRAFGSDAVDVLLHTLRFGRFRAREAVLPILVGLPVDPARLQTLVDREVDVIRRLILQIEALRLNANAGAALQRLRERLDESSHTAVVLIAAARDDERLARVGRLLGRTHSTRDRALVLEALEALLPPKERERLLPLLEDGSPGMLARRAAEALGRPLPTFEEAVAEVLASSDGLSRDLLRGALPAETLARVTGSVPYERTDHRMTPVDMILLLRRLDLFAGLTTRQLGELARVVAERQVAAGETIVREGEFDARMYFIVEGHVRVTKEGTAVSALGPGEFFGEIAVFDGERRSASVIADGPVRLLRLDRQDLFEVMEEHPAIAVAICQTLSRRIRDLLDDHLDAAAGSGTRPPGGHAG